MIEISKSIYLAIYLKLLYCPRKNKINGSIIPGNLSPARRYSSPTDFQVSKEIVSMGKRQVSHVHRTVEARVFSQLL